MASDQRLELFATPLKKIAPANQKMVKIDASDSVVKALEVSGSYSYVKSAKKWIKSLEVYYFIKTSIGWHSFL